jgi:methyl-accepting chemotaxis protein
VAQEQAASSEEIAEAVQNISTKVASTADAGENIRSGVGEVAVAAERIAQGAESLSNLAGEMQDLLNFFRMDGSEGGKLISQQSRGSRLKALPPSKR